MLNGILYLAFAILAFGFGIHFNRETREKGAWPTVQGKLLERGVGPQMKSTRAFLPHVKYSYVVAGTEYVGDQFYLIAGTGATKQQILKEVNSLPDAVPVHYNAADPKQAYLVKSPQIVYWLLLGFGTLAALLGLMQLLTIATKR